MPVASEAQRSANVPQIGFLGPSVSADDPRAENFRQFQKSLRDLGYIEGKNISIAWRLVESYDLYPAKAAELVSLKVAAIVTPNTPAALAAKSATATIPIVFTLVADPVGSGLVASLSRSGGNVTGLSNIQADLTAKRDQLLKEALPTVIHVAILINSNNPGNVRSAREALDAAPALRVRVVPHDVQNRDQLDTAFDEMKKERPDALLVLQDAFLPS
jgi:putative ABC transport system substrate-binding protein